MSAALVKKSLALVDPSFNSKGRTSGKGALDFLTDKKLSKKIHRETIKPKKEDSLSKSKKLTVIEVRQEIKCKEDILQRNLKKLHLIKKICMIDLDPKITSQLFERAVTRRPVSLKSKKRNKKLEHTVFSEQDFKQFEEEYMVS